MCAAACCLLHQLICISLCMCLFLSTSGYVVAVATDINASEGDNIFVVDCVTWDCLQLLPNGCLQCLSPLFSLSLSGWETTFFAGFSIGNIYVLPVMLHLEAFQCLRMCACVCLGVSFRTFLSFTLHKTALYWFWR